MKSSSYIYLIAIWCVLSSNPILLTDLDWLFGLKLAVSYFVWEQLWLW